MLISFTQGSWGRSHEGCFPGPTVILVGLLIQIIHWSLTLWLEGREGREIQDVGTTPWLNSEEKLSKQKYILLNQIPRFLSHCISTPRPAQILRLALSEAEISTPLPLATLNTFYPSSQDQKERRTLSSHCQQVSRIAQDQSFVPYPSPFCSLLPLFQVLKGEKKYFLTGVPSLSSFPSFLLILFTMEKDNKTFTKAYKEHLLSYQ